ncbi:hypothetical protein NCCP28_01100 [Niallia sp. NCCP-28]|nr:hypothetical protein NCCP28_01100 [Niallia sp. NCCP-28]
MRESFYSDPVAFLWEYAYYFYSALTGFCPIPKGVGLLRENEKSREDNRSIFEAEFIKRVIISIVFFFLV